MALLKLSHEVSVRRTGLVLPRTLPLCTWEAIGRQLLAVAESSTWWIADWLAYGEVTFHDRYREAIKRTSLNYQTLRNYVWVARRFELSRRRDSLSFGHHAEVAALDNPEQDYWLRKAEEFGWSRNQLRGQVRSSLRERQSAASQMRIADADDGQAVDCEPEAGQAACGALADLAEEILCLRPGPAQLTSYEQAASSRNLGLEEWAIEVLNTAARGPLRPVPGTYRGQACQQ